MIKLTQQMYFIEKMTIESNKNDIRCMVCRGEFILSVLKEKGLQTCPNCNTRIKPMRIVDDGYIKINWEDIRLIAIYAQRWADRFDTKNTSNMEYIKILSNIINIIQKYQPRNNPNSLDHRIPNQTKLQKIISPYYNNADNK